MPNENPAGRDPRRLDDPRIVEALTLGGAADPHLGIGHVPAPNFLRLCDLFRVPPARGRLYTYPDGPTIVMCEARIGGVIVQWQCNEQEVLDALAAVERAEATP